MIYPCGSVVLQSTQSLEEVARELSRRLFAGVPFGGRDEAVFDEVPAVYIREPILGFFVTLSGHEERHEYVLRFRPWTSQLRDKGTDQHRVELLQPIDLSAWLVVLLSDLKGIVVAVPTTSDTRVMELFGQ